MQADNNGWQFTEGRSYLPDCIQVSLPKESMATKRGRELGVIVGSVGVSAHTKTMLP